MELDNVFRILERVAGEQEHDRFVAVYLALANELLQAGEGYGGCRLATDTFLANLCFCQSNLRLAYLLAIAAGLLDHASCLAPGSRVSNPNGAGPGVGLHGLDFSSLLMQEAKVERVGALGLHYADFRDLAAEPQVHHFQKAFA